MDPVPKIRRFAAVCPRCEHSNPLERDYNTPVIRHLICHQCENQMRVVITESDIARKNGVLVG
jgi:hypothetical protein